MMRLATRLLALVVLAWIFGLAIFVLTLPGPAGAIRTDAIVVLTGGPGRVARGVALLRAGRAKRLLISGVDRTVRPHELAVATGTPMRLFDCCIDLGFGAVDTRSNADETAAWMQQHGYRSLRIVTSAWHMPRARMELSARFGPDIDLIEDAVPAERAPWPLIQEYAKYVLRLVALKVGLSR